LVSPVTGQPPACGAERWDCWGATSAPARDIPQELRLQATFLRLMLGQLQSLGFAVPGECWDADYAIYNGDRVTVGRGEILIRESSA
jgi:hypothetical protein